MFSKALFKQSMKANWVKWVSVTTATCVMLAIVIIVLGNLAISDIRDSLKNIFVQADQESQLKEQSVDGYELYISTVESYDTLHSNVIKGVLETIINDYQSKINLMQGEGEITNEQKELLMSSTAEKYAKQLSSVLGSTFGDEEYLNKFFYYSLIYYDSAQGGAVDYDALIDSSYTNTLYNIVYITYLQTYEGATAEMAELSAQSAKDTATVAINKYKEFGNTVEYDQLALQYMNNLMYEQTYNMQIQQGYSEDDAKMFAVSVKVIANTAITSYQFYLNEDGVTKEQARTNACQSISDQIPEKVAQALTELGNMDMYSLIIGSIFYRIAGLLLAMIFLIMTANGLLAGQVDSGSMAYVLSTPTKRRTVAVTQMVYLVSALFAMFALLTIVSVIAVFVSGGNDFAINYGQILLFNLGAFLTMFAIAGFCYMCSSIFNRTKYSLGLGGGLTIFSLVCTILGLFGSSVVPSAMRIEPMNFFNYLSIITLYDTNEIMTGSTDFIWKFAILFGVGLITFIIGLFRFEKKDLPL